MVKVVETDTVSGVETRPISYLLLEDGTVFQGYSFGANRDSEGEIGNLTKLIFKKMQKFNLKK